MFKFTIWCIQRVAVYIWRNQHNLIPKKYRVLGSLDLAIDCKESGTYMGRLKREMYIHAMYHVFNRGNNRVKVFEDEEDKINFLNLLAYYRKRFAFKVFAICLMDNHYHMIIQVNNKHSISKIMHALTLAYSVKYRDKHEYVGHLWQSRFKSRVIEREKYLMECLDYVHQNPVKAEMVDQAKLYKFSSAGFYEGKEKFIAGVFNLDSLRGTLYS